MWILVFFFLFMFCAQKYIIWWNCGEWAVPRFLFFLGSLRSEHRSASSSLMLTPAWTRWAWGTCITKSTTTTPHPRAFWSSWSSTATCWARRERSWCGRWRGWRMAYRSCRPPRPRWEPLLRTLGQTGPQLRDVGWKALVKFRKFISFWHALFIFTIIKIVWLAFVQP